MKTFQIARYLLLFLSTMLALLSIGSLTRLGQNPDLIGWYAFYALAMLVDAAIMLVCYFWLKRKDKRPFQLTMIILILNMVLIFFDQIGLVDILFMLLNGVALVLFYLSRKEFSVA